MYLNLSPDEVKTQLNSIATNRDTNESHVKWLMKNMRQTGKFIGVVSVVRMKIDKKEPKLYVIDGQHRILAASNIGMNIDVKVEYDGNIITMSEAKKLMKSLNSNSKIWSIKDHIKEGIIDKIPNVLKLVELSNTSGLSYQCIARMLYGCTYNKAIQNNHFELNNLSKTELVLNYSYLLAYNTRALKAKEVLALYDIVDNPNFNLNKVKSAWNMYYYTLPEPVSQLKQIFTNWVNN